MRPSSGDATREWWYVAGVEIGATRLRRSAVARPLDRPIPSSPGVSERMRRTPQHGTAAERAVRSELHRRGLRFRIQRPLEFDRRRKADIVFPKERLAIFVDGCF